MRKTAVFIAASLWLVTPATAETWVLMYSGLTSRIETIYSFDTLAGCTMAGLSVRLAYARREHKDVTLMCSRIDGYH